MFTVPPMDDLENAWNELHDANETLRWSVARPDFDPHLAVPWTLYAFDPTERAKVGHRSREWTAVGMTEVGVVREMAR